MMTVIFSIADITLTAVHRGSNSAGTPMHCTVYLCTHSCSATDTKILKAVF